MAEMKHYSLGAGNRSVDFVGILLAEADSHAPGKDRWSEVSLYRTEDGCYVAVGCGKSKVPGEEDRHWAEHCQDLHGVVACLSLRRGRVPYLPRAARDVLDKAARSDADVRALLSR